MLLPLSARTSAWLRGQLVHPIQHALPKQSMLTFRFHTQIGKKGHSMAWKSNLMAFLAEAFLCAWFTTPQPVLRSREVTASWKCRWKLLLWLLHGRSEQNARKLCQLTMEAMEAPFQDTSLQLGEQVQDTACSCCTHGLSPFQRDL